LLGSGYIGELRKEKTVGNIYDDLDINSVWENALEIDECSMVDRALTNSTVFGNQKTMQNSHDPDGEITKDRMSELMAVNHKLKKALKAAILEKEQFRRSEKLIHMAFDGTEDPLFLLSSDMKVKMHNWAVSRYFGITETEDILDHPCYWSFHRRLVPCENCPALAAISIGKTVMEERKNPRNPEKVKMYCAYPLKNINGELEGIVLRITDITERKLFEKQLIRSEKLASLGLLISSIAHEINNPNNFITLNIPILRAYFEEVLPIVDIHAENQPDLELVHMPYADFRKDVFNLLDNVDHGAARIGNVISALKGFSQVNGPREERWVDLGSLINRTLAICDFKMKSTVKSFIKEVPSNLPKVFTDPDYLEQIIINLLVNAADACGGKKSWVRLGAEVRDTWSNHTMIEVTDNGCGMDQETMGKIFDPFFTTKSRAQGTGLGLYICHNLVEGLGGRIEVESCPGSGSTFRVILPDKDRRKKKRV